MSTATMEVPQVETSREVQAATILQRAVCLVLHRNYLGNNRKIELSKVVDESGGTLTVDEEQFHTSINLVDPKVLRPVMKVQGKVKRYLVSRAITAHRVFGDSTFLIPMALVEEVDRVLTEFQEQIETEALLVSEVYEAAVEEQRAKVGAMFDRSKYPSKAQVARAFRVQWHYVQFQAPDRLETVNHALFEASQRHHQSQWADAFGEARLVLRSAAKKIVDEMIQKLRPGDDGKPKAFRGSALLRNLSDFLATYNLRDITDDAEMGVIVDQLRRLADGIDPETLNDSPAALSAVLAQAKAATDQLDVLIETGRRGIRFD